MVFVIHTVSYICDSMSKILCSSHKSIGPRNVRGCQSSTWSTGQDKIRGASTKLQREHENIIKTKNKGTIHMPENDFSTL